MNRSLLRFSKDLFASFTIEKREISSAKSLTLVDRLLQISLIHTKKNSGPRIESWGTPAFTGCNTEV